MSKATVTLEAADAEVSVVLHSVSRVEWAGLLQKHPARQKSDDRVWNEATFPPALIAACAGLTEAWVRTWWDEAPTIETDRVFETCLRLSAPNDAEWAVRRLRASARTFAEVQAAARLGIPRSEFLSWSDDDQDWMIALMRVEGDTCPGGCGVARGQMQDPTAYRAVTSRCIWCQQLEAAREAVPAEERGFKHVTLIPQ